MDQEAPGELPRMKQPDDGPDFSGIDSLEKATQLTEEGVLIPLLLLPTEFGGEPVAENTVFVPPFVQEIKERTDREVIGALIADGKVSRYSTIPQYEGRSFVPSALVIRAWDPQEFSTTIAIWGAALGEGL